MRGRRSLDPDAALTPGLLGRETIQLAVVAVLSLAALAFAPGWLRVVAGIVDVIAAVVSAVAFVIAWRVSRMKTALAIYGIAFLVFALLAVANFLAA